MSLPMKGRSMRSQGSALLGQTGLTHDVIAAELGVSRQVVQKWLAGERKPGAANLAAIARRFGVPAAAWDAALSAPPVPAPPAPTLSGPLDAEAKLREQLGRLEEMRRAGSDLTPSARMRLEVTETRVLELLSKLTGESQEISEARILRLPAWRRIQEAIVGALVPWPEAAIAVVRVLEEMGD